MKRIALVTDAWHPQVNGVVRVTEAIQTRLRERGYEVLLIDPSLFTSIPLPLYREIRFSLRAGRSVARMLEQFKPDAIHVMTEGPLGFAARRYCRKRALPFTSWYHTHFHFYINLRLPGLLPLVIKVARRFHASAERTFVSTEGLQQELEAEGFTHLTVVPLGVDTGLFKRNLAPNVPKEIQQLPKPVYVFFSRLAVEKSPEEFLQLPLDGTKLVIGDGPDRPRLESAYGVGNGGDATFVGYKKGQELVDYLSTADVMIFPSRTETFGLAALEAMACGVPVAAHNVLGPRDIITEGVEGYLSDDLAEAAQKCLTLDREACRQKALKYSWEHSVDAFIKNLVPIQK